MKQDVSTNPDVVNPFMKWAPVSQRCTMHMFRGENPILKCKWAVWSLFSRQLCHHHPGAKVSLEHLPQWAAYHDVSIFELA